MVGSGKSRQQWSVGSVVKVPLGDGGFAFGQMLKTPEYAFFDLRATEDVGVDAIVRRAVLFRLWVMRYAHSTGRWTKIGSAPLSEELTRSVYRFKQDSINPSDIHLYKDGKEGAQVSAAECSGLECAAVWDPDHVEHRLRDHFAGRPNKWAESLRVRI